MNRTTVAEVIDHGKTLIFYGGCTVGLVIATLNGNDEAREVFLLLMAGGGLVQGGSAIASKVKNGGGS